MILRYFLYFAVQALRMPLRRESYLCKLCFSGFAAAIMTALEPVTALVERLIERLGEEESSAATR